MPRDQSPKVTPPQTREQVTDIRRCLEITERVETASKSRLLALVDDSDEFGEGGAFQMTVDSLVSKCKASLQFFDGGSRRGDRYFYTFSARGLRGHVACGPLILEGKLCPRQHKILEP